MDELRKENIDTRPLFYPLSSLPAYQHLPAAEVARKRNPNGYKISERGINLPSGMDMNIEKVKYVCQKLREKSIDTNSEL